MAPAQLHQPNTFECDLDDLVPRLLGKWRVVASTLPLWKDKKNVVIEYKRIEDQHWTTIDDLVSYNKRTDTPGKAPSTVHGTDKLESVDVTSTQGKLIAGPRWKWRGRGWLMIASSRWQVLGHNLAASTPDDPEWVVTYFASTLFTPAGLDIYTRTSLPDETVERLTKELQALGGEVGRLADGDQMFRIPHD
ncbi:hypothetical protein OIV83_005480 [Microbotryomycetes sp. JL201]|nr:hypothetical protein OIV83_005480 [Microbotryomycetes sp. JL201]